MQTAATSQLHGLLTRYQKVIPLWTFPWLPLAIAATFQSFAWMAGPIFLNAYSLWPRVLLLWMLALGEYSFMSPSMNAGVEVLGMPEPLLVVIYQVMTLLVFMFINVFVFKRPFQPKFVVSFALLAVAVWVAYM